MSLFDAGPPPIESSPIMKLVLHIDADVSDSEDLFAPVNDVASNLYNGETSGKVYDQSGKEIGFYEVTK